MIRGRGGSRRSLAVALAVAGGMRTRCATSCASICSRRALRQMRCLSSTRPGFLKQGKASCGVARRYTGSAGKITNCQVGVFAAYVSRRGHAFIDRALYLPKAWTSDPARMAAAHVPTGTAFATKPALAVHMIARAIAVEVAFAGVAADSVYRVGDVEQALRKAGKGYVLGVNSNHHFGTWKGKPRIAGTANEPALATSQHRQRDRAKPRSVCVAAAIGGRRNQGCQTARLGLSRARRPRRCRIR